IMFAGPLMNLVLAFVFISIVVMGIGLGKEQPVIGEVAKCTVPAGQAGRGCAAKDPATPAFKAGLKPGDRFLAYDGHQITTYAGLQKLIRASSGRTVPVVVRRGSQNLSLNITITSNQLPSLTDPNKIQTVGYLGVGPTFARE